MYFLDETWIMTRQNCTSLLYTCRNLMIATCSRSNILYLYRLVCAVEQMCQRPKCVKKILLFHASLAEKPHLYFNCSAAVQPTLFLHLFAIIFYEKQKIFTKPWQMMVVLFYGWWWLKITCFWLLQMSSEDELYFWTSGLLTEAKQELVCHFI